MREHLSRRALHGEDHQDSAALSRQETMQMWLTQRVTAVVALAGTP